MGLANDLTMVHEEEAAASLLTETWKLMREVRGEEHPETLTCAVNYGLLGAGASRSPGWRRAWVAWRRFSARVTRMCRPCGRVSEASAM